ncbi:Asp23/Gls24 family envelope stress response protein [Shouchella shacheensis]|uniref:Asp23/Gls24 family envelope stress response protein n=1 Tax=Shouchella shacheensis TaxID=1649580 RepID=UPI0007403FED|nr:Asp23/Gls24 family envelope stress response protein [Shouchella shacheensis]
MTIEMKTQLGAVDVSQDVVAIIAGGAAIDCYGIVGMASQKQLKDGLSELLGRDNFQRGVITREEGEDLHIDMYIIVSYGTKISEVAHNVQTKVKYSLEQMLGLDVDSVNIFVQGVRVANP